MSTSKLLSKIPAALALALPQVVSTRKDLLQNLRECDVHKKGTSMTLTPTTNGLWVAAKYVAGEYASLTALLQGSDVPVSGDAGYALRLPQTLPSTYDVRSLFGLVETNPVIYVIGQLNLARKHQPTVKAALSKIKTVHELGRYFLSGPAINQKLAALLQFTAVEPLLSINGDLIRAMIPPTQMESHLTSLGFSAYNSHFGAKAKSLTAQELLGLDWSSALEEPVHLNSDFKITGLRPVTWRAGDSVFRNIIWRKQEK